MSHRLTDTESVNSNESRFPPRLDFQPRKQGKRLVCCFVLFFPDSDSETSVAVRACSYRMSSNVNGPLVPPPTSRCFHQQRGETTNVRVAGARAQTQVDVMRT